MFLAGGEIWLRYKKVTLSYNKLQLIRSKYIGNSGYFVVYQKLKFNRQQSGWMSENEDFGQPRLQGVLLFLLVKGTLMRRKRRLIFERDDREK